MPKYLYLTCTACLFAGAAGVFPRKRRDGRLCRVCPACGHWRLRKESKPCP